MIAVRPLVLALALLALAGCISPYQKFYHAVVPVDPTEPAEGEPRLLQSSGNTVTDIFALYEQGFGIIGYSEFDAAAQPPGEALLQAKVAHAAIVVLWSKYQGTVNGVLHFHEPSMTMVDTYGTERSEGARGTTVRHYNEESWVYGGTEESDVPYHFDYYDQAAFFFAPMKRQGFGALLSRAMTDDQRRLARTEEGLWVNAVRQDSPAHAAGIQAGDALLSIDGKPLQDLADWHRAYAASVGREVDIVLSRAGTRLTKRAILPAGPW